MKVMKCLAAALPLLAFGRMLVISETAFAQIPDQVFVGTRPLSMGEAFVAVADDGNAIAWNPAGLARLEGLHLSFARADLFGLYIDSYYATFFTRLYFIPKLTDYFTIGADWSGIKFGDSELEFRRDQFNFSLGFKPPYRFAFLRGLNIGANVKYLQLVSSLSFQSAAGLEKQPEADAQGVGWDLGLLYEFKNSPAGGLFGGLNLGVMIHDLGGTEVKHKSGAKEEIQRQLIRWGLSYRPFEKWPWGEFPLSSPVLAVDFDDRLHVGLEFWLNQAEVALALRSGIQKSFEAAEEGVALSFGVGLKLNIHAQDFSSFSVDYGNMNNPGLPATNDYFNGEIGFKDNPRMIRIEGAHIDGVYASLHRHYAKHGARVGSLKLRNVSERDTMKTWVALEEGRYLREQEADTVRVPPLNTVDLPVRAAFDDDIIYSNRSRLRGKLRVKYEYKDNEYETVADVDFALHGKNYLTWDDPAKAAAFIVENDTVVISFVNHALERESNFVAGYWLSRYGLEEASTCYQALQAFGVKYHPDPVTPYAELADTLRGARYRLDTIKYPGELLHSKTKSGDCDDLTVLYASLLQQAGVATAMVSGPGHIFMMFDTGIPAVQRYSLPFSPALFVERNGTLWAPVETTLIEEANFASAWQAGAGHKPEQDSTWQVIEVAAGQAKYPPAKILLPALAPDSLPDFAAGMQRDIEALVSLKQSHLQSFEEDSLNPGQLEAIADPQERKRIETRRRNQFGAALAENDELDRAEAQFKMLVRADSLNATALNNWANVKFMQGDFVRAESLYAAAQVLDMFIPETYFNLAVLYQALLEKSPRDSADYQAKINTLLAQAAQLLQGDLGTAYAILGLSPLQAGIKAAPTAHKKSPADSAASQKKTGAPPGKQAGLWALIARVKREVDKAFATFTRDRIKAEVAGKYGVKREREFYVPPGATLSWSF